MSACEVERARRECMEAIVAGLRRCGVNARLESLESTALDAFEAAVRAEEREAVAAMLDGHGWHAPYGPFCRASDRMIQACSCGNIAAAIRAQGTT